MTDFVIPITNNPAQSFNVTLSGQSCIINLYQKDIYLYFDMTLNGVSVINSRICLDRTTLVFEKYIGFIGSLFFVDTQGTSDPSYDGLGTRYVLFYRDGS